VAANLFFFASFQWIYVTLPGYIQEIGGDAAQIGLAFGLATLSAIAVRPFLGTVVDRWGRKVVLLIGAGIFCLVAALYTLADSIWPLLAVRLLLGVGMAAFTTAYTALVADLAPPARRGEAVGLSGVTNNLGMLFAPALGAAVQARWGYASHFWVAAGIAAVSFLFILPVKEPRPQASDEQAGPGFWRVARLEPVWTAAIGGTGLAVAYGVSVSFMPPLAAERGLTAAGGYFTAFALAVISAQAGAGWLSDRIGRRAVAIPGMVAAVLSAGLLGLAGSNEALLVAGVGLGLSWGLVRAGLDTAVVDAVPPRARGTALSVLYTLFDAGIGLGSFGLGLVAGVQGYAMAFYVGAGWALVILVGYLLWTLRAGRGEIGAAK
jgi:MFS family permease